MTNELCLKPVVINGQLKGHRQPPRPKRHNQQIKTQLHHSPATDPIGYVGVSRANNLPPLFETQSGKCVRRNFLPPRPPMGGLLYQMPFLLAGVRQ